MTTELYNKVDHSSLSNLTDVTVTHIDLKWNVDFDRKIFEGSVEHTVQVLVDGTKEVHLDSSNIHLTGDVYIDGQQAEVVVEPVHASLGSRIVITIPAELRKEGSVFKVHILYAIDPEATAVQWLPAESTKGGKCPFVFTQCQAIHARSLLPCMDSPSVKTTYSATVTAPVWCTVLMSALAQGQHEKDGQMEFLWNQPVPTPAYLIALAAGRMASKDVSERVRIWAEPEVVDAAHFEFSETEDFVRHAEDITGCKYQWTRYDVVCLPPSFPYGGMENPCLTFATPTLLAGDKSLADVIAHEIAHSWTGNLVTNHTWDHFWLNEGWTVWLERKITSRFKKNDEVGILSAQIGYRHLEEAVDQMKKYDSMRFTRLIWPLQGEDPDDAFSSVPYEKGFNLLNQLETIVGRDLFEGFAQKYIDTFKFKTVTSGEFRDTFVAFVKHALTPTEESAESSSAKQSANKAKKNKKKGKNDVPAAVSHEISPENKAILDAVDALDWDKLFMSEGMPDFVPNFQNSLSSVAQELAQKWISHATTKTELSVAADDLEGWGSAQICLFLEALLNWSEHADSGLLNADFISEIDNVYQLTNKQNAEIKLRWQTLCLRANVAFIVPHVVEFITSQGRMKFVRPLYSALRQSSVGGIIAQRVFDEHKQFYHPIARKMIDTDLQKLAAALKDDEDVIVEESEIDSATVVGDSTAASEPVAATLVEVEAEKATEVTEKAEPLTASEILSTSPVETQMSTEVPSEINEIHDEIKQASPVSSPVKESEQVETPIVTPQKSLEETAPATQSTIAPVAATPTPTPVKETPIKVDDPVVVTPQKTEVAASPVKEIPVKALEPVTAVPQKTEVKPPTSTPVKNSESPVKKASATPTKPSASSEVKKSVTSCCGESVTTVAKVDSTNWSLLFWLGIGAIGGFTLLRFWSRRR